MAKNYRRQYESFADIVDNGLDGRESRKVQHNTYLRRLEWDNLNNSIRKVGLLVHATNVLEFTEDGVTYNSGGWRTKLTRERMNEYGPVHLYAEKGEWYCIPPGRDWRENDYLRWLYFDGMMVDYRGNLLNPRSESESITNMLAKKAMHGEIERYCDWIEGQLSAGESLYTTFYVNKEVWISNTPQATELAEAVLELSYSPEILQLGMERRGIPTLIGLEIHCGLRPSGHQFGEVSRDERMQLRKTLRAALRPELLQESVYMPIYEGKRLATV